jgi:hypothetical protein
MKVFSIFVYKNLKSMKDKIDEIQKLLEELGGKISEVKSKLDWLINQETLIIPKEEFKNFMSIRNSASIQINFG